MRITILFLTFLFLVIGLWAPLLHAYDKPKHRLLTAMAFDAYKICTPHTQLDKHALITGSSDEDNPWPSRLLNWHFYNPEKNLGSLLFFIDRDPHDLLARAAKRIDKYRDQKNYHKLSGALGRYIHHIQDLTVPAHVIPYFHSSPFHKDKFDGYPLNPVALRNAIPTNFCQLLSNTDSQTLPSILDNTYYNTKAVIKAPLSVVINGMNNAATWELFWPFCQSDDFCHYRDTPLGNRFGETTIETPTGQVLIDENQYIDLAHRQGLAAIVAAAKAMRIIEPHTR